MGTIWLDCTDSKNSVLLSTPPLIRSTQGVVIVASASSEVILGWRMISAEFGSVFMMGKITWLHA
jgi:hypothetical protein